MLSGGERLPRRLRSLWDMLELDAQPFVEAIGLVQRLRTLISADEARDDRDRASFSEAQPLADNIRDIVLPEAKRLRVAVLSLGATITSKSVGRLLEQLTVKTAAGPTYGLIARSLDTVWGRLIDELEDRKLLAIEQDKVKYYSSPQPLFSADFAAKYQSAAFELDEAGKCFALGRPTASIFHLMRLMEISVRAVARCLAIPDPTKPAERNWGFVLGEIWKGIEVKWPTTAARMSGDGETLDSLYASLDAVKNPWRNSTMHPANKYTDDEAEHIFLAVKAFMTKLAARCDENGDPKA
jgi:hypothetical protein